MLERNSEKAVKWFGDNGMQANPNKFQVMILEPYNKKINFTAIHIETNMLELQNSIKFLGVYIDSKLSFGQHVKIMCNKASRQVNAIQRLKHVLPLSCKQCMYQAFIRSTFEYCKLVWYCCGKTNDKKK